MAKKNLNNKKKEKRRNPRKKVIHEHWKFKNGRINRKKEKKLMEKIKKSN